MIGSMVMTKPSVSLCCAEKSGNLAPEAARESYARCRGHPVPVPHKSRGGVLRARLRGRRPSFDFLFAPRQALAGTRALRNALAPAPSCLAWLGERPDSQPNPG